MSVHLDAQIQCYANTNGLPVGPWGMSAHCLVRGIYLEKGFEKVDALGVLAGLSGV